MFYFLLPYILILVLVILHANKAGVTKADTGRELPFVSVWVAARNEQDNIFACLKSLENSNYPVEKFEVLVGDDASEDNTAALVKAFIVNKPNFKLINVDRLKGKAKKKANVLAHLAAHSRGELYLVCDADVVVAKTWINNMVASFDKETGTVSGSTAMEEGTLIGKMQSMDWLFFLTVLKATADIGIPGTGVGNNMAFTKEAYWQTGGYEAIDFSITEDFKLFDLIVKNGWKFKHRFDAETLNVSAPQKNFKDLLKQRKRWLTGAKEVSWLWKIFLLVFGSFYPLLLLSFFFNPQATLLVYIFKVMLQSVLLTVWRRKLFLNTKIADLIAYEFYLLIISPAVAFYYFLPNGKSWKGRNYGLI
jgi:cellulose synthase/poly-beta-1,6-N-acetylglucosamine synthase-like glycosyltransferase